MSPRPVRRWPLVLIAAPAAVAVWSGLGRARRAVRVRDRAPAARHRGRVPAEHRDHPAGRGGGVRRVRARRVADPRQRPAARRFARRSALGALALGMAGQVIYHLLAAAHATRAPWPVVVLVSCLPVLTLGFGAALTHLLRGGARPCRTPRRHPRRTDSSGHHSATARGRDPGHHGGHRRGTTQDASAAMPRTRQRSPRRTGTGGHRDGRRPAAGPPPGHGRCGHRPAAGRQSPGAVRPSTWPRRRRARHPIGRACPGQPRRAPPHKEEHPS